MHNKIYGVLLLLLTLSISQVEAQKSNLKWWNPSSNSFKTIEGQGWSDDIATYQRLPNNAKENVRKAVWDLSTNSAGLSIRFRTNSDRIVVRYKTGGGLSMPHMPATGDSGVDIYAKDCDGAWHWCRGRYSFGDTIKYDFSGLNPKEPYHNLGREYRLYLPLYNDVKFLEIGIPDEHKFEVLPLRNEKPIVVYGTSITQGACASRPGMAWTNILSRTLDHPIVNLGFSGNGRLEDELFSLLSEIDAKLYVIDCLPNMVPGVGFSADDAYNRMIKGVKFLKSKRPNTPILLVEHSGYSDGDLDKERGRIYTSLNKVLKKAYEELVSAGIEDLHLLTRNEINLDLNSYVDGTHPSDLGMMQYATAYDKSIRKVLNQPTGVYSTMKPVTQYREPGSYDWDARHQTILAMNKVVAPEVCVIGNSIMHYWSGEPKAIWHRGDEAWKKLWGDKKVRNMACGWDRIENVLWRVYHGQLDGFDAKQIVMKIGTNNLQHNTDEEILAGLKLLVQAVKSRQPKSKLLMVGILPRRDMEQRIAKLNQQIARIAASENVSYVNVGKSFLNEAGKINESLFSDGLHPNKEGYEILSEGLKKHVQ
ncbi:acetylhydrolase [Puteibacter caeruleilacunae]|nr:acetylhydrolase [Puteibacter caeruleilacunae]